MKINKILVLFIGCVILLSGCQPTPESVKERSKNYISSQDVEEKESGYVSVEHLLDNQEEILKEDHQNLKLLDTIHLEQPEHVSILTMKLCDDFSSMEKMKSMAYLFFGNHKWEKKVKDYSHMRWATKSDKPVYGINEFDEGDRDVTSGSVSNNGSYAIAKREQRYIYADNRSAIYHVDWGGELGTCKLSGETVSLAEAVDYVNDWCNTKWTEIEPMYTFRVKTVYQCKDKTDFLFFDVCRYYKGVPFDDISFSSKDEETYWDYKLEITMRKMGELSSVRNNNFGYNLVEEENCDDKLIGLGEAINIVEHRMTGSRMNEITDIDIKYEVRWAGDKKTEYCSTPGTRYEARPVWSFIVDAPEYLADGGPWTRKFINVDMVTGEVMYQDECEDWSV